MKLKAVLILLAVVGVSCAQPEPPANVNNTASNESTAVNSSPMTGEKKENECRICDYDFESYKGDLKKGEVEGLLLALNDEYLANAIYKGVNEKFDNPRPFINIVRAEERHMARLIGLFNTYKIPVPENLWLGKAPVFESVKSACEAGVEAEVANRDLYTRLFKTTERQDITLVYKNLQSASEDNHKPAFERCASGGGNGKGRGNGRGQGRGPGPGQ